MNFKKVSAKILSVVMALAMLVGVCAPTIMAVSDDINSAEDKTINYVSIGDSMANGYCFEGYNQTSDDRNVYDFMTGKGMYGNGAYPLQFEEYLKGKGYTVNHTKLATSAMLAEDFLFLLGAREEFNDGWGGFRDYIGTYDEHVGHVADGITHDGQTCTEDIVPYIQNAVIEADIITLGLGNASFGAYLLNQVTSALGVLGGSLEDEDRVTLEDALAIVESEELKKVVMEAYDMLIEEIEPYYDTLPEAWETQAAVDIIIYTVASFLVNYEGVIDRIMELNPDVEIILVGLMNTTYGMTVTGEGFDDIPIGDIMNELFGLLNAYVAGLPAVKQAMGAYPLINAEQVAALEAMFDSKKAEINEKAEEEIAKLTAELDARLAELRVEAEAEIEVIKAEVEAQIVEIKAAAKAEIEALKAVTFAEIAELEAAAKAEIEALRAEAEAELLELNAQLENAAGEAREEILSGIKGVNDRLDEAIAKIEADLDAAEAELKAAEERQIATLNANLDNAVAEAEAELDEQIEALSGSLDTAIESISNATDVLIEDVKVEADARIAELLAELDAAIDELDDVKSYYYNIETGEIKIELTLAETILNELKLRPEWKKIVAEKAPVFYYAAQPNPLFISQAFDELSKEGWNNIDCGDTDCTDCTDGDPTTKCENGRLSGDTVRDRTIDAYNDALCGMISMAFASGINAGVKPVVISNVNAAVKEGVAAGVKVSEYGQYVDPEVDQKIINLSDEAFIEFIKGNDSENIIAEAYREATMTIVKNSGGDVYAPAGTENTYDAYTALLDYQLGQYLIEDQWGFLPGISLNDVKNFEAAPHVWSGGFPATRTYADRLYLSVAVYLGIEAAIAESCEMDEIALDGLMKIAGDLASTFDGFSPDISTPVAVKEGLANFLTKDDTIKGMCKIFALFKAGNGMSVHPTPTGHDKLADAVIEAYEEKHTVQKETVKNLGKYGAVLLYLAYEYREEIYAEAYKQAVEAGLIEDANEYLDIAQKALNDAEAWIAANAEYIRSEEFANKLNASMNNARSTIEALRTLINEGDQLDVETAQYALALLDALYVNLVDVYDLLNIAAVDAGEYADPIIKEFIENVKAEMEAAKAEAKAKIEELIAAAEAKIEELKAEAEKQIAILKTELEAKIAEIKAEAEKQIEAVKAELEAKINALNEKVESEIARLKAEAEAKIAEIKAAAEAKIAELKAQAEKQLAILEAELLQLNEQLKTAVGEAKAKIEAKIAEIKAEIARIKAELEAKIAEIKAEAEAKIAEIKAELEAAVEALKAQIEYQIEILVAAAEAKIAEIKAEIEAQIEALKEKFNAIVDGIKADLEAAIEKIEEMLNVEIDAIKSYLEATLNALGIKRDEAIAAVKSVVAEIIKIVSDSEYAQEAVKALKEQLLDVAEIAKEELKAILAECMKGEYTVSADSFYLAIGGDFLYTELLRDSLALGERYAFNNWGEIDYNTVKKADLITIGFNENQLNGFAIQQASGFVADYLKGNFRASFVAYLEAAATKFLSSTTPSFNEEFITEYVALISSITNEAIDGVANDYLGGATATELDWAALVGEENVEYVDKVRDVINEKLAEAGIEDTFAYEISISDLIYENKDLLGEEIAFVLENTDKEEIKSMLGEYATYTLEIPMRDALVFAGESYIYGYAQFQKEYSETVLQINAVNPDATVVILGHYNALRGVEELEAIYAAFAEVTSIHPIAYAVLLENTIYVDIMDAETVYGEYLANGMEANTLEFAITYLADHSITGLSEAGNEYVADAILGALEITCEHVYDNVCDAECNYCGYVRDAAHDWTEATCTTPKTCKLCGATEGDALGHSFGTEWHFDSTHHWQACTCGEQSGKAEHADSDKNGLCDVCGYKMGDVNNGEGDGGTDQPDDEGNKEPVVDEQPTEEELSEGAVVAIVLGSTLAVSVGGFAIFWFVIKKKSFAALLKVFKKD